MGRGGGGGAGGGAKEAGRRGPGFVDILGRTVAGKSDLGDVKAVVMGFVGSKAGGPLSDGVEAEGPLLIGAADSGSKRRSIASVSVSMIVAAAPLVGGRLLTS